MLLWPFIKKSEQGKLTEDALNTQVLYMSGLFFFLAYWVCAYIVSLLLPIDLATMMPYGMLGSGLFGYFFWTIWIRRRQQQPKSRVKKK